MGQVMICCMWEAIQIAVLWCRNYTPRDQHQRGWLDANGSSVDLHSWVLQLWGSPLPFGYHPDQHPSGSLLKHTNKIWWLIEWISCQVSSAVLWKCYTVAEVGTFLTESTNTRKANGMRGTMAQSIAMHEALWLTGWLNYEFFHPKTTQRLLEML